MIALLIIGGLMLLFILIGQLRVRISASFGEEISVAAKIGPVKLQLVPLPEKKPKPKGKAAPKKAQKPALQKERQGLTLADIRSLLPAVGKGVSGMARRTRKCLRIDPLDLSFIAGGDPFHAAKVYGYLSNTVFAGMPILESAFHIPNPRIHLDMDVNAERTKIYGSAGFYLRICDAVAIAMALFKPLAGWFVRRKKTVPQIKDSVTVEEENKIA